MTVANPENLHDIKSDTIYAPQYFLQQQFSAFTVSNYRFLLVLVLNLTWAKCSHLTLDKKMNH